MWYYWTMMTDELLRKSTIFKNVIQELLSRLRDPLTSVAESFKSISGSVGLETLFSYTLLYHYLFLTSRVE